MNKAELAAACGCILIASGACAGQGQSGHLSNGLPLYPGYFAGMAHADMLRNAVLHPGGGVTIPPGGQRPEASAVHQRMCEALGGDDVTDVYGITLAPATLDAAVCLGSIGHTMPAPTVVPVPGIPLLQLYYPLALPTITGVTMPPRPPAGEAPRVVPLASIGSTPLAVSYVAVAGADFLGLSGPVRFAITATVRDEPACEWQSGGLLSVTGDVRVFGYALCLGSEGDEAGTTLVACIDDDCRSDHGTIRFYD